MMIWNKDNDERMVFFDENGKETDKENARTFMVTKFGKDGKVLSDTIGFMNVKKFRNNSTKG